MKHAYLIIAHNDIFTLKKLIECLDDERNDIFIHIDLKSNIDKDLDINTICKNSRIYLYKEIDVKWGDKSQVECELLLLKKVCLINDYSYLHIISGTDLPIKSQSYIHDFFDKNSGKEFIHFDSEQISKEAKARVLYKHLFTKMYKKGNKVLSKMKFIIDNSYVKLQSVLGLKKKISYNILQKGCNWCSITGHLAQYIINQEDKIIKLVEKSKCADEVFIQTIVENSEYRKNLYLKSKNNDYTACLRYIIWDNDNKKSPKTLTKDDFDKMINSKMLFARKFNSLVDKEIINKICDYVKEVKK